MAEPKDNTPQTPVVDEQTRLRATRATPALTGAQRAAATIQERKDKFAAELAAREASKPTTDPGEGNVWSYNVAQGKWKKVNVAGGFGGGITDTTGGVDTTGGGATGESELAKLLAQQQAAAALAQQQAASAVAAQQKADRKSAFDLLFQQFSQYGLGSLVAPLKDLIESGVSPAEFTIRLRETDAYKKRFAANAQRIAKGLRALSEAEYITLEDQYQNVMRRYGLPPSYYARGDMGIQQGFEKFIAGDVSPVELEDRIQTAQDRVINASPNVMKALRQYFPEVSDGDVLAYILDPENSIGTIKRKITTSEIGGAALESALALDVTRASELQRLGVTGQAYRQAAPTIKQAAERGSQLASFFNETPYTQQTAESLALGVGDAAAAQDVTRRLIQREQALYQGRSGPTAGALGRERAGQI